jgi:phospholipid N-methyltransferase
MPSTPVIAADDGTDAPLMGGKKTRVTLDAGAQTYDLDLQNRWRLRMGLRMNDITMPDVLFFLRAWTSDPLRVAAIAPSGPALAELITREITPECGSILELGPGTGVFTRALLARGVRAEDLTLVENSADFAELLRMRFPETRVLQMNAARLYRHHLFDDAPVGAVVSGLPLLSMPQNQVLTVLAGAFGVLREDGAFYQFTYGLGCPIPRRFLDRLGLKATCLGRAYLNIPPAAVYRISRRRTAELMVA